MPPDGYTTGTIGDSLAKKLTRIMIFPVLIQTDGTEPSLIAAEEYAADMSSFTVRRGER